MPIDLLAGRNEGINVQYECLGGNDYLITVHLFRDCAEFTATPDTMPVFFTSSCEVGGGFFQDIYLQDSQEVSQLCPDSLPSSSCNGGTLPGVNLSIFSRVVNLPPCADWQIIVAEQNRAEVLNLDDPIGDSRIHVEAFLNNASGECNTSPQLGLFNLPFVCVDNDFFYNLSFNDPDGDSLVYNLAPALASTQADMPFSMAYEPGFSPTEPVGTGNLIFDSATGQMNMTPTTEGKYTVVVEVKEYRDGLLIGTVYLDFNIIVIPCAVPPPTPLPGTLDHLSGGGYPFGENIIGICPGDDFCLELDFASTDPTVELILTADIALSVPGATFSQSGINPAAIEFCGSVPDDFTGADFVVSAIDDFCSIYGQAFYAVQFVVREPIFASPDTTVCAGESVQLLAENDTSYTWFGLDGNQIPTGTDFSCNPCADPTVTVDSSMVYIVQGAFTEGFCQSSDTVEVTVPLDLGVEVVPETCFEDDGVIDIAVLTGSGDYTVVWDDDPTGSLIRTDLNEGTYSVTITDNVFLCSKSRTFELDNLTQPTANAGSDDFACGMDYHLTAVPSFGETLWTTNDPELNIADPTSPTSLVTATGPGVYELQWKEDDGAELGCVDSATVQIEFFDAPTASVSAPDSICGFEVEALASGTNGTPNWELSSNVSILDPLASPAMLQANTESLEMIIYQTVNGPCIAADTAVVEFIAQPAANAGEGTILCGDEINLFATASAGVGQWLLPDEVIPFGTTVGPSLEVSTETYGFYDVVWQEINQGYCFDRDTIEIGFIEVPDIEPLSDTSFCGSMAQVVAEVSVGELLWEGSNGLTLADPTQDTILLSAVPGSYQLNLVADNGFGCMSFDTLAVTFYEQPDLLSEVIDTICGFDAIFVSPITDFERQWTSPDLGLSSSSNLNVIATAPGEGDYEMMLVVDNQDLCFDTTFYSLSFYEQPEVTASADFSVCGLTAQVSALPTVGSVSWSGLTQGGSFSDPTGTDSDFSVLNVGESIAVVTATNGACLAVDSVTVSFEPSPEILNPDLTCTGIDATYQLTFTAGGDYGNGFLVDGLDGSFFGNEFSSVSYNSDVVVQFTLDNFTVCSLAEYSGSLTCPIISSSGEMDLDTIRVCGSEPAEATQINAPQLDGNDALKYVLHDNGSDVLGTIFAWADLPEFAFSENLELNTVYYISAVVGNPLGEEIDLDNPQVSISQGQPVIFLPQPSVSVNFDETICPTDTALVEFEFSGNFPQAFTYSFNGEDATIQVDGSTIELAFADSGTVQPVLTASTYCTGTTSGAAIIAYHPEPELEFNWDNEICSGDTSLLQLSPSGVSPFEFDFTGAGSIQNLVFSGDTVLNLTVGADYEIAVFSDQLCTLLDTFLVELIEYPLPEVNAGADALICTGDSLVIGGLPAAGVTYTWGFDLSIFDLNSSLTQFSSINEGFFPQENELILFADDENCSNQDTVLITVYPEPEVQIFAPSTVCQGDSMNVIGYGAVDFQWSPAELFSDPDSSVTGFFTPAGIEIALEGANEAGCASTALWGIEVVPLPAAEILASAVSGCDPLEVDLSVADTTAGASYVWNINGDIESSPELTRVFSDGQYAVSLEVTSPEGCQQTAILPGGVTVYSASADFGFSPESPSITGPEVFFFSHGDAEIFFWSIDTLGTENGDRFVFEFPSDVGGDYEVCLVVISPEGCTDQFCQTITVKDDFFLYIPTAFTPDGDGLNDLFYPELARIDLAEYRFWITNRRGDTIFETNDPTEKWNGSENNSGYYGKSGLYQWHLSAKPDFNLDERFYNGSVMMMR